MDRKEFEGLVNRFGHSSIFSVHGKKEIMIIYDGLTAEIEALKAEKEPVELEHECSDGVHTVHMPPTLDAGEYIFTVKECGVTIAESLLTVREPTEYEQVKAICKMSANEIHEKYEVTVRGKWGLRQLIIWKEYRALWDKVYCGGMTSKEICKYALELADRAT